MSTLTIDLATATEDEVTAAALRLDAFLHARDEEDEWAVTLCGQRWFVARTQVVRVDLMREGTAPWADPQTMDAAQLLMAAALMNGTSDPIGPDSGRIPYIYAALMAGTDRQVVGGGVVRFYRGDELVAVVTQCREDGRHDADIHLPNPSATPAEVTP